MTLRRTLANRLAAEYVPAEPEEITDPLAKGVADALARRGITEIPGRQSAADVEWAEYRARTRRVLDALTPRPTAPPPEPEPERPARLADQIRALIGNQTGAIPLNGQQLIDHATARLHEPGAADSAASGQLERPQ